VNFSPAFKWCVALLLPLTLVLKLADTPDDPNELKDEIIAFASRNKFEVTVLNDTVAIDRMPLIRATTGQCSLVFAKASAYGWSTHLIRDVAGSNPMVVLFRGKLYPEQPVLKTLLTHIWSRMLRIIGLVRQPTPVIAVIAAGPCEIERLPWTELRGLGTS
jgi:hypothetical protein